MIILIMMTKIEFQIVIKFKVIVILMHQQIKFKIIIILLEILFQIYFTIASSVFVYIEHRCLSRI